MKFFGLKFYSEVGLDFNLAWWIRIKANEFIVLKITYNAFSLSQTAFDYNSRPTFRLIPESTVVCN